MAKEIKADTAVERTLLGFSAGQSPVKSVRAKVGEKPPVVNGGNQGGTQGGSGPQGGTQQGGGGTEA